MSFSYLKDHDNCMDVLLYIFCDSAFNVVKAFIRGTPPSLLCDNLKCELGLLAMAGSVHHQKMW